MFIKQKRLMSKCRACGNENLLDDAHRAGSQLMKNLPKDMSEIDVKKEDKKAEEKEEKEEENDDKEEEKKEKKKKKKVEAEEEEEPAQEDGIKLDSEEIGKLFDN
jgi:hypothetical protein